MITNTINLKGNILGVPNQTKVLKKKPNPIGQQFMGVF